MSSKKEIVERVEKSMKELLNQVNYMGMDNDIADAMAKVLIKEHNTIQQTFWRVMQGVAKQYGEMPYHDGRNEQAVKFAKQIAEIDIHLPFI